MQLMRKSRLLGWCCYLSDARNSGWVRVEDVSERSVFGEVFEDTVKQENL